MSRKVCLRYSYLRRAQLLNSSLLRPVQADTGRRPLVLASRNIELILLSKQARPHLPNPLLEAVSQSEHSVTRTPSHYLWLAISWTCLLIPHAVLDEEASEEEQL